MLKKMKKIFLVIIVVVCAVQLQAKPSAWVQRVEPTYWWTNMQQSEFQIMLYGADIASADVSVDYGGVTISHKELTDNHNYVFLYLNVAKETLP